MRTVLALLVAAAVGPAAASAQVVTEWGTPRGLPVAVVEIGGGDIEYAAAVVPPDAAVPAAVAGFPTALTPGPSNELWSAAVPSLATQPALAEFVAALGRSGAASLVIFGPVPAREIRALAAAIDVIPATAPPHPSCALAEGAVEERSGALDSVELAIALPQPGDPRSDLSPAIVSLVHTRLAAGFPDARVTEETVDGCARLVVRVPSPDEHPRAVLRRLRQALAQLPTVPVGADELGRAVAACEERAGQALVDGGTSTRELAGRLAAGGSAVRAFSTPAIDGATLAELGRQLLGGHPGSAVLFARERRVKEDAPRTLENGVTVSTRWIPGETGVVAVALGGVTPRWGHEVLAATAATAARQGWPVVVGEIVGVPTLAIAAPGAAIADAIERVAESLSAARGETRDDLEGEATRTIGLAESLTAEKLSVALALPPEVEIGAEAVEKFFGGFPAGSVTTGVASARVPLQWAVTDGAPRLVGVAELPASAEGLVAWRVLRDRLRGESGVRAAALAPTGRLLLEIGAEGGENVPALDGRLAAIWKGAQRPAAAAEVAAAARGTLESLYGDAAQAAARAAATLFLPAVPRPEELLAIDAGQVNRVIAALPAWEKLTRFARGPAPPPPTPRPAKPGVRKSHTPARQEL